MDMDDWLVYDDVFNSYEKLWGMYIVDRFVIYYNKKCERFNFKYWCFGIEVVDAFI